MVTEIHALVSFLTIAHKGSIQHWITMQISLFFLLLLYSNFLFPSVCLFVAFLLCVCPLSLDHKLSENPPTTVPFKYPFCPSSHPSVFSSVTPVSPSPHERDNPQTVKYFKLCLTTPHSPNMSQRQLGANNEQ